MNEGGGTTEEGGGGAGESGSCWGTNANIQNYNNLNSSACNKSAMRRKPITSIERTRKLSILLKHQQRHAAVAVSVFYHYLSYDEIIFIINNIFKYWIIRIFRLYYGANKQKTSLILCVIVFFVI